MARRSRKSVFGVTLQRSLNALTRATLRRGTNAVVKAVAKASRQAAKASRQAVKAAASPAPRRRAPGAGAVGRSGTAAGQWRQGIAVGPSGARRYRLFTPAVGAGRKAVTRPLLVMLHGCTQDAAQFARSTRLQALAGREGFMLLFPEQERLANPQGCWNWFETRSGRAYGEAASILAAVDQACALHGADPARVAVAGFSAGAGMAALLALRHPERFAAAAMHSGVAPGAAHSTATAIAAMQGRRAPDALVGTPALPPLLVIQGTADHIVFASNGRAAAHLWAAAADAKGTPTRRVQRGSRHAMSVTDFRSSGRTVATLCEIEGLGHAWSGGATGQAYSDPKGPDAGRMVWAFALRCFDRALRALAA